MRRRGGCREATTELDLHVTPEIAVLMGEVPASPMLRRVTRLTRDQIDVLERMRGNPSHGQTDHGY